MKRREREKKNIPTIDSHQCANFVEGRGADNTATDIANYTVSEKAGSTSSGEPSFFLFSAHSVLFLPNIFQILASFTKFYQSLPRLTKFTKFYKNKNKTKTFF